MEDIVARYQEIERRGLLDKVSPQRQALWNEYKRRHPELNQAQEQPIQVEQNLQPLTEEQKAKSKGTDWWDIAKEGLKGFKEGVQYGVDKLASGATLGLTEKIFKQANPDFSEAPILGKAIGTGLELIGSVPTGLGILGKVKSIPKLASMALPISGAIEGGLTSGIKTGDIKEAGKGAIFGGALGTALKGVGKVAGFVPEMLGLTSGAGSSAVNQAVSAGKRGSKPFLESMRKGSKATNEIIDIAENDIKQLGNENYKIYKNAMDKIGGTENIRLKPIRDTFSKIVSEEAGGKSYLVDENTKKVINKVDNMLKNFAKDNKRSLKDFDDLKQAIGKISPPLEAKNALRVQSEIYNTVKREIEKQAPVYSDIMKESSEGLEKLAEFKKTFSLGRKSSGDTVLRKLQSSSRNNVLTNYGRREELLRQLPHGEELADRIAGQTLNTFVPRGIEAKTAALIGGGFRGLLDPSYLAYLASSSPRVVGELAYKAGQASKYMRPELGLAGIYKTVKEKK